MLEKNNYFLEIALFSGSTVLLLLLSIFFPFVSMLMPLPITILTLRRDSKASLFAIMLIAIPVLLFIDAQLFLAVILITGLIGFAAGNAFSEKFASKKTFIIIFLVAILAQALYFGANYYILDSNIILTYEQVLGDMVAEFKEPEMEQILTVMMAGAMKIFPTFIFISGFLTAIINYYGAGYLAPRFKLEITPLFPFSAWRLPKAWSLILLLMGATYAFTGKALFLNAALVLAVILTAVGSSVLWCKFKNKVGSTIKRSWLWLILIIILVTNVGQLLIGITLMILGPIAFLAGLTDGWLNFRRL